MTTITTSINPAQVHRARLSYGIVLLAVGLFIYLVFGLNTQPGVQTTYGINLAGSAAVPVSDLVVPSQLTVNLMAAIAVFVGAFQLARGIRSTGWLVGLIALTRTMQAEVSDELDRFGANIVITAKSDTLDLSYGGLAVAGLEVKRAELRPQDAAAIRTIHHRRNISVVSPKLVGVVELTSAGQFGPVLVSTWKCMPFWFTSRAR